ncbi:MAG: hypothetical protein IT288_12720 [Bdellovibrionales bacterium]|nr:hypothetical protein [Bdellovibrionales bacterium]
MKHNIIKFALPQSLMVMALVSMSSLALAKEARPQAPITKAPAKPMRLMRQTGEILKVGAPLSEGERRDGSESGDGKQLGNERGNGGDVVVGPNGAVRFLDLVREPRSEIFDPELEGLTQLLDQEMRKHIGLTVSSFVPAGPDARPTTIARAILGALGRLTFYLVSGPIPEVNDRGVVVLPWNLRGKVVRLALQERASGNVVVDRHFYAQLPIRDRVAFFMHEALIRLWNEDYQNEPLTSTDKIANCVHILFNRTSHMPEGMTEKIATRYLCDAGYLVSERSLAGLKKLVGIMAAGSAYFPNNNFLVFRQSGKCYTVHLRLKGPAHGSLDPNRPIWPFTGMHRYVFEEINTDSHSNFAAGIVLLLLGHSGVEEFWFESANPETPMIFGAKYGTLTQLRVTVVGD